jgi:hypothetical protein
MLLTLKAYLYAEFVNTTRTWRVARRRCVQRLAPPRAAFDTEASSSTSIPSPASSALPPRFALLSGDVSSSINPSAPSQKGCRPSRSASLRLQRHELQCLRRTTLSISALNPGKFSLNCSRIIVRRIERNRMLVVVEYFLHSLQVTCVYFIIFLLRNSRPTPPSYRSFFQMLGKKEAALSKYTAAGWAPQLLISSSCYARILSG